MTSAALRAQARSPFEPFQRDLPIVPTLLPVNSTRTQDNYEIAIREGMAEILPGFQTPIYGYEGIYPGPTIRARKGRKIVVRQRNTLPFESNVHLHGGYVPAESDGHPMDVIAAGGSFDYVYPNQQDAATLWYHDHAHGRTSKTLYYGLNAMYVLEDDLETELGLPQGEYDVPIVIGDHAFNRDGSFRYAENVDVGFRGDTILANGVISPRMRVQRRKYRLRFLNASNARSYTLKLGKRARDDADRRRRRPAPAPGRAHADPVPPGRADRPRDRLLRSTRPASRSCSPTRRAPAARYRSCASTSSAAAPARTSRFRAGCATPSRSRPPTRAAAGSSGSARRPGRSTARAFDPARIDARPRLGSTEIWTFVNRSNRVHPMHIHGFLFRMLERTSRPVDLADRLGWKDTVGVMPDETVSVLAWFAPYAGKYVFHCHALEHADKAMMLQIEVVK